MVSGRLTSKKLQDLYTALQEFNFKAEHIEEAMTNTILYGGDLHSALDWLCLNLPDGKYNVNIDFQPWDHTIIVHAMKSGNHDLPSTGALPEGFSQQFVEEEQKVRAKFCPPPHKPANIPNSGKSEEAPAVKASSKKDVSMKEWILRYAEQGSDDEEREADPDKDSEVEEFDPNERYLELTAKLFDAKAQAASTKQDKDKAGQREAQEKIRTYLQEMKNLEQHPMFNPDVKLPEVESEKENSKSAKPSAPPPPPPPPPPLEDEALNLNLFESPKEATEEKGEEDLQWDIDDQSTQNSYVSMIKSNVYIEKCTFISFFFSFIYHCCILAKKKPPLDVRNFDYTSRSWTGKSPKQFLIDWCRKHYPKSPNPTFEKVHAGRYWRSRVKIVKSIDNIMSVCPTIVTEDSMQAQHLAATLALYELTKGQSVHQLLPPTYREVWLEWSDAEKSKEEKNKLESNKPRDQFITKLLNKLKLQQPLNKPEKECKVSDDPEDSWENLAGDEELEQKTSIPVEKENLEAVRNLFCRCRDSGKYKRLLSEREQLPVFARRNFILETLNRHRVVVVAGETGSGKSTQVPQFLLEDLLLNKWASGKCNIVCTQPRRISAMSLATRVCEELGCESGPGGRNSLCGYQIRMESRTGEYTKLLYCTTGILLRKLQEDSLLKNITHVIVDEVHERTVQSDFLLIILREILHKRSDLHLVLMSATVDSDKFSSYFSHCPIIRISGRTYPVEVFHLEDVIEETGFVLEQDSEYCQKFLEDEEEITLTVTSKGGVSKKYQVICRAAAASSLCIVLATNIAETGITIPDVVFVIDAGKTKENRYHESSQMSSLVETFISKASALQRQGRAGRVQEGFCFRLYTKENLAVWSSLCFHSLAFVSFRFHSFMEYSVPEILRVPLEELCLHIMKCDLGSPEEFLSKALDPPQLQVISNAMNLLRKIGACELTQPNLTPLGQHLAALPVNVKIGKMLIFGAIFGCLDAVATLAATMTEKSPFVTPIGRKDEADLAKSSMALANSDHLTIFSAYMGWKKIRAEEYGSEMSYCRKNFLNRKALLTIEVLAQNGILQTAGANGASLLSKPIRRGVPESQDSSTTSLDRDGTQDVKQELIRLVRAAGFDRPGFVAHKSGDRRALSSEETSLIKAVLTAGLYDNVGKILFTKSVDLSEKLACMVETAQGKAQVHPSSVNRDLQTYGWLLYQEKVRPV
ncbi:hypothetical protein AB205_0180180 [Aquarana catesbeiana]|uniref:RNA helicase n=1 Tax=Aquarana catesbeiana TaxID=8400 RepID=A0A2G9RJ02_AQUCT|nr:hypothetical protein AB205_0180180 [Aquarana catesbeiana]